MSVLEGVLVGSDVQKLNIDQLNALSLELRERVIDVTEKNGGHLSANLGIIETTVALYKTFDFPKDKILFDVGHQCYAHKILSGRNKEFDSIRLSGGISGFPLPSESEYDCFIAGHAGNSISAGLGLCQARDKLGEDYTVVSVVGDASVVNGLNLEAMSVNGNKPKNFIVILNDNGMAISKNANGLYQYLSKSTTKRFYRGGKKFVRKVFRPAFMIKILAGIKNFFKRLIGKTNYFEEQGFKYVGVIDGHDMKELVKILKRVKIASKDEAILLHVNTTKGKGLDKAEAQADLYHGVSAQHKNECGDFSLALGEKLNELIEKDDKIIAITAGMKDGTGLSLVEKAHPKNFVDVGIAEEYAVTSAGGMAVGGLKPLIACYSTFLQRAYDQIIHDVCMQNLPVVFCIDRAGVVGNDGITHQGVFDLSYLLHIPNMKVFSPATVEEFKDILERAFSLNCPVAIRYPKSSCIDLEYLPLEQGEWQNIEEGDEVAIIAVGPRMIKIAREVSRLRQGVGVISARTIKPLPLDEIGKIKQKNIITLEENSVIGGFGSYLSGYLSKNGVDKKIINLGIEDKFIEHGCVSTQLEKNGLTVEKVLECVDKLSREV